MKTKSNAEIYITWSWPAFGWPFLVMASFWLPFGRPWLAMTSLGLAMVGHGQLLACIALFACDLYFMYCIYLISHAMDLLGVWGPRADLGPPFGRPWADFGPISGRHWVELRAGALDCACRVGWSAMAGHGKPWSSMASNGGPWPVMTDRKWSPLLLGCLPPFFWLIAPLAWLVAPPCLPCCP